VIKKPIDEREGAGVSAPEILVHRRKREDRLCCCIDNRMITANYYGNAQVIIAVI
jgi:hypothetical protein